MKFEVGDTVKNLIKIKRENFIVLNNGQNFLFSGKIELLDHEGNVSYTIKESPFLRNTRMVLLEKNLKLMYERK